MHNGHGLVKTLLTYLGMALMGALVSAAMMSLGKPAANAERIARLEEKFIVSQEEIRRINIKLDLLLEQTARAAGAREESEKAYQKVLDEYRKRLRGREE